MSEFQTHHGTMELLRHLPYNVRLGILSLFALASACLLLAQTSPHQVALTLTIAAYIIYVYVAMQICMTFALRQIVDGRQFLIAGSLAALIAVVFGATLYASCSFGFGSECYIALNGDPSLAQVWERWGRYVFFAFPVCLGLALLYAAMRHISSSVRVSFGELAPSFFFALLGIGLAIWVSADVKGHKLAVVGPDLGNIQLIHLILPFVVFLVLSILLAKVSVSEASYRPAIGVTLAAVSLATLVFFIFSTINWKQDVGFFFASNSATGVGLMVSVGAIFLATMILALLAEGSLRFR